MKPNDDDTMPPGVIPCAVSLIEDSVLVQATLTGNRSGHTNRSTITEVELSRAWRP